MLLISAEVRRMYIIYFFAIMSPSLVSQSFKLAIALVNSKVENKIINLNSFKIALNAKHTTKNIAKSGADTAQH